ncbi:MAG: hypothetical protein IJV33_10790 [Bacteroidaceae bacterium]|nr:hypothetical protein [Bacteroidaceae bacterium]
MKAKVLFILALLCTIAQGAWAQNYDVWDGSTATRPQETNGTIHITTAAELAYISNNFTNREWSDTTGLDIDVYSGASVETTWQRNAREMSISLDADINMSAGSWTPMGWSDSGLAPYDGTFNGNGHTIRIRISGATEKYQGLFARIDDGAVKNLHVEADIHCDDSRLVGGIAGENNGTIENCWVSGLVRSDWKESSSAYTAKVGGIAGENNGTIQYCCVTANVQNDDADVGGIVGDNSGHTISHCTFYGTRTSAHDQYDKYVGDHGTESDLFDTFNQGEYDAASGKDLYRKAIKYTYDVTVKTVGPGTIRTWAADEYDVPGTRNGVTFSLNVTSGSMHSYTIKDADGNNISLQGNAHDWSSFWFVMPKKNVTATVVFFENWPTQGAGTSGDPYLISSADDWNKFARNVNLGRSYSGKYVKLADDISVSNVVGDFQSNDSYQPFSGIFDGNGKTLTINLSNQSRFAAPFKCVSGATIKNLRTTGTISGTGNAAGKLLSGVVGLSFGTTTITGCVSSVTLTTDFGTDAALAGIVAGTMGGSITISGCVFDGSMTGSSNTRCAGVAGYEYGGTTTTISDCLFAPKTLTVSTTDDGYTKTITRDGDAATITGCYYTQPLGAAQGMKCVLAASIPDNLGSPTAEYGMVTVYPNGILSDGKYYGVFTTFSLADTGDNTATITGNNGYVADVTLQGRTLYKDGDWNTLCLPFDVTLSGSPLEGATARALESASISGTTLNLQFGNAVTTLQAGTPYIIKWESGSNIVSPFFEGVAISSTAADVVTDAVTFRGTFSPVNILGEDRSILFLGSANTLYYPNAAMQIGACRAYFQLNGGITAGDPGSGAPVRTFVLHFGDEDEATGIISISKESKSQGVADGWYTLDGRRLQGQPSQRGIYINNGKKIVIK